MELEKILFWDVDTQHDFMDEDGALYVPGAETIKEKLGKIRDFLEESRANVMGSMDWHDESNPELQRNGGPFPDHCMAGTHGAEKIPETLFKNMYYANTYEEFNDVRDKLGAGSIIIRKQTYNVFDKKDIMDALIEHIRPNLDTVVIYGVATDYCVKAAALGFADKDFKVFVIEDAVKGVAPETTSEAISDMRDAGVKFITFSELKEKLKG